MNTKSKKSKSSIRSKKSVKTKKSVRPLKNKYYFFTKKINKLAKKYKKLCSKKKKFNSKVYISKTTPGHRDYHISLTNNRDFIKEHKKVILENPIKCEFKIKKIVLFKTKSKGPYRPSWYDKKDSDYPLVWFTLIIDIISMKNINKNSPFDTNIIKKLNYNNNLHHVTTGFLSLKGDADNNCNYRIGYENFEDKIVLKPNKSNNQELNKLIKKLNKYKTHTFEGTTDIDKFDFLAFDVNQDKHFKNVLNISQSILKNIFSEIIE